jgi:hypothetical protein
MLKWFTVKKSLYWDIVLWEKIFFFFYFSLWQSQRSPEAKDIRICFKTITKKLLVLSRTNFLLKGKGVGAEKSKSFFTIHFS